MRTLKLTLLMAAAVACLHVQAQGKRPEKPRIIVSTDIGGTDPDDNQSLIHLMMYSDKFDIEGLISTPSYGKGSVGEIRRMIGIYEKDYPKLLKHSPAMMSPDAMRAVCKQGARSLAPYPGFSTPTEGSRWIVKMARKKSRRKLWILVWGTLEDVAQALHDAPDIKRNIRVYYIGGPNKKWGANSYAYIAACHRDLWMIENNSTYRGFITDRKLNDRYNMGYYDYAISGAGSLGSDFRNYYGGEVKMGDTPSLLYLMDGDPEQPCKSSWGGSFVRVSHSPRRTFYDTSLTQNDTVPPYSIMEMSFTGPSQAGADSTGKASSRPPFTITIDRQAWPGTYIANGIYKVRYCPKAPGRLSYSTSSDVKELDGLTGEFNVGASFPGSLCKDDYPLGDHWYTDRPDTALCEGRWQGAKGMRQLRKEVLDDWAERWQWLR